MGEEYRPVTVKWYGIVMIRTKRFQGLMDKLGSYKITKPAAWLLLYIMPVAAGISLYMFLTLLGVYLSPQNAGVVQTVRSITPLANISIPGLNPFLPITYGWLALIIAMVIHEAAHGVVARSLNLPVKSAGLIFFLILPIGAFVDVDETILKTARARDAERVLAAGAGVNFLAAFAALALMLLLVSTMVPVAQGAYVVGVAPNSPAFSAGLQGGDFVTQVNSRPVTNMSLAISNYSPGQTINLTVWRSGNFLRFNDVKLASCTAVYNQTNKSPTAGCLGTVVSGVVTPDALQQLPKNYLNLLNGRLLAYVCPPTFPRCAAAVPFSDSWIAFYKTPLGGAFPILVNVLYWIWFINFFLATFNSLPIYPLDGGQAFQLALKALGKGKLSDLAANRITNLTSLLLVFVVVSVIFIPYLI
jgi:membrane-associated protease RseP (regulator of RpoE activity)